MLTMQSKSSDKTRMVAQGRSEGDGMENHPQFNEEMHSINMKYDTPKISTPGFISPPLKRKEPRFVPYEPYKAAVAPLIPKLSKKEKANLDKYLTEKHLIKPLAKKVIESSIHSFIPYKDRTVQSGTSSMPHSHLENNEAQLSALKVCCCEEEKKQLENKIKLLSKEKQELESQFKIQTQVNGELKKLLVASMGEDLQLKVQYLSEDKAKLGKDVLFYSEKLTENNEELEKISVQCDIWKSKYQASSVIIDELAAWKVVLSRKFNEATEALKSLLDEHNQIFHQVTSSYQTLLQIQNAFDVERHPSVLNKPSSLLSVANAIKSLSLDLENRLLGASSPCVGRNFPKSHHSTPAEELAKNVIASIDTLPILTKFEASKESDCGLGAKACKLLPHACDKDTTVNCCKRCSGEVKLI